jgi:sulfopyruvate decarboxylase TPP-binding subunit
VWGVLIIWIKCKILKNMIRALRKLKLILAVKLKKGEKNMGYM